MDAPSTAAAPTTNRNAAAYVRTTPPAAVSPPPSTVGPLAWLRERLFPNVAGALMTILIVLLLIWSVPPLIDFLIINATWTGSDRDACLASTQRPEVGACWVYIGDRLAYLLYGSYPITGRWRVDIFFAMLGLGTAWLLWLEAPRRDIGAIYFFVFLPVASFVLLHGFEPIGLAVVDTALWGGFTVTIVVAAVGIVVSLPIGIVLALGRRSALPAVRLLSTLFIEFIRGVPLITVLFMASVMLPLFVPESWSPDKLLRALVGVALFSSAYMAEVVRAGLQAMPKGQYEAAHALGLSYWQTLRLIILPQALKVTIPNIVNSYIALFKDTTLVFFVGIFDFLKTIEVARADPKWSTPVTSATGYIFAAVVYFVCCYAMSRYATSIENRLSTGEKR
jgi:general L-amino acid transport system permease protein